ncbi:hypothetical protein VHA01S_016_00160 [Vibrio halioticoli NBRC 102217]|uniref:Flagella basal body P-ring formation protein FlgA C-terminal domain-containing protein n=1 Tax=Vibrio halioticoli NBRC 102217 TaxID=1219072 RepID=V5F212_9VIBR|nr:hypothetical protein [Vibrio halioticoli]GAD89159.1 hypothetical protein VHA01S_016_00160 [Vibrio halioticoli NBRC 102217]
MLNILKVALIGSVLMAGVANADSYTKHDLKHSAKLYKVSEVHLDSRCEHSQFNLPKSLVVKPGALNDVIIQSSVQFHRGIQDPYLYESDYVYNQVKSKLLLSTHWLCEIKQNRTNPRLWLVPSVVRTSGSGAFYYLDVNQKHQGHYSIAQELFLGDRIEIESLVYKQNTVELSFKQHSLSQSMAEKPNQLITRRFTLSDSRLFERKN